METHSDYSLMDIKYAFLAGLIEGDGCIAFVVYRRPKLRWRATFGVYTCVVNTKREMLDFLKQNFGGSITGWQPKGENKSFTYSWRITGKKAKFVLLQIYPYLITKKLQAKLAIEMQNLLTTGKRDTRVEHEKKMQMVEKMHILNAKEKDKQGYKMRERKVKKGV